MFRKNYSVNKKFIVNCLVTGGGIGDLVCSMMSINYIIKNSPWITLLIWVPDYLKEFFKNVLPKQAIVRNYSEGKKRYNDKNLGITTQWKGQHTPMRTNPVKYSFHVLCDYSPTIKEMSYLKIDPTAVNLKKFNLSDKFVCIQATHIEQVKTMPSQTFNNIVKYVSILGDTPVFLGKTANDSGVNGVEVRAKIEREYNLNIGLDLVNKTSILESACIINKAKALICMDGGLVHIGAFTDTPIISAVTFVNKEQITPVRDGIFGKNFYCVEPDDDLECKGCQSNLTLYYNWDFRNCIYSDYLCVKQITFDKFKIQIDKVLK